MLLHNNACPHAAARMEAMLQEFGWEVFEHPDEFSIIIILIIIIKIKKKLCVIKSVCMTKRFLLKK
jgi:hypothetical protein